MHVRSSNMIWKAFFVFLATSVTLSSVASSAKILGIFAFPGKSHSMMIKSIIRELSTRGHEVTFITNFPMEEKLSNFTEIVIEPIYDFWSDVKHIFQTEDLFELTEMSIKDVVKMLNIIGLTTTEHALKQPKIQELIRDNNQKFDLLIVEQFYQEAFLALKNKYNAPIITVSTLGFENYMSQMMGVITPWSHVPHGFLPYLDKMTIYERIVNTYYSIYEDFNREFTYFPQQDVLIKKYLSFLPGPIQTVSKMEKNISLMLLNSYAPLTTTRPSVPGMVPVGGVHIRPPKPLPNDIQLFLDGAKDGALYFSLGTNLKSSDIPPKKLQIFLDVFSRLKQRVLWKFEDENIKNLPKNIMIKKWMPQNDILAHSNVKVFITHGGLFGTQEGVYHGVPMLGIPVYCDQHLNMNKAAKAGYAISLYFPNITEESLTWALEELLYNPSYMTIIQKTSKIFRDRPLSAIETAMYWIEYVLRHNGATHIRSSALDLPWYSFYLLDIFMIFSSVLSLIIFILYWTVKYSFRASKKPQPHKKLD